LAAKSSKYRNGVHDLKTTFWPIVLIVSLAGCGGGESSTSPKARTDGVHILNGKLTLDGRGVHLPCRRADLESLLGKASRQQSFAAEGKQAPVNVYTWDDFGIYAHERPGRNLVTQLSFVLDRREKTVNPSDLDQIWPAKNYQRPVVLEFVEIKRERTPEELNDQLKDQPLVRSDKFPFTWTADSRDVRVKVLTQNGGKSILEVSVGSGD
jgi:hypothetical protein